MSLFFSLLRQFVLVASAQNQPGQGAPGVSQMWSMICDTLPFCDVQPGEAVEMFTGKIVTFVFSIIGGVALVVIIYAGIRMIYAEGKEEGLSEAKKIIVHALAGIVLALLAVSIVGYVLAFLQTVLS